MNYWMLVTNPENFAVTKRLKFEVQGFSKRQKRKTDRMAPGDRLLFYVTGWRVCALTATLQSTTFRDTSLLWTSHKTEETFPHRVRIRLTIMPPEDKLLDALEIAPRLEYVRRWPPDRWPLAFEDELHLLPRRDFELIEGEILRLLGKSPEGAISKPLEQVNSKRRRTRQPRSTTSEDLPSDDTVRTEVQPQ